MQAVVGRLLSYDIYNHTALSVHDQGHGALSNLNSVQAKAVQRLGPLIPVWTFGLFFLIKMFQNSI